MKFYFALILPSFGLLCDNPGIRHTVCNAGNFYVLTFKYRYILVLAWRYGSECNYLKPKDGLENLSEVENLLENIGILIYSFQEQKLSTLDFLNNKNW